MDPYEILGIAPSATDDEIKQAYRKQAKKWHPDVNKQPGAEAMFKNVQLAHAQLTGKAKRPTVTPPRPPAPSPTPHGNGEFYATRDAYAPWDRSSGFYPSPGGTEDAYRSTWDTFFTNFDRANGFHSSGQSRNPQPPRDGHTKPDPAARERAVKEQQAEAVLDRAREQAEGLRTQGQAQAETILSTAKASIEALEAEAHEKARVIKIQAEAKAAAERARIERELEEARQQVDAIRREFEAQAKRVTDDSALKMKAVQNHAEAAAWAVEHAAEREAAHLRK